MPNKIFLIDDDVDDRDLFYEAALNAQPDIICSVAASCAKAFAMLEKNEIDVPEIIFLDINMPGKNGWECLTKLKAEKKFWNIPVIMYSTSSSEPDIGRTRQYGALGLFTKPDDYEELSNNLRVIIAHLNNNTLQSLANKEYRWFVVAAGV